MMPHEMHDHVADQIPDFVLGRLSSSVAGRIRAHLAGCEACADELQVWQRLTEVELRAEAASAGPSPMILARVLAEIDAGMVGSAQVPTTLRGAEVGAKLLHGWRVLGAERRLFRRTVWIASALGIVLSALYAAILGNVGLVPDVLAFALPLVAAAGMAFLYGPDNDPSLELSLATATSARMIVFARFMLLFGFDAALAVVATLALAAAYGDSFWALAATWFGSMALLATLSLATSLAFGPLPALASSAAIWLSSVVSLSDGVQISAPSGALWRTSPQILAVSLLLLAVALVMTSRLERLPEEEQHS